MSAFTGLVLREGRFVMHKMCGFREERRFFSLPSFAFSPETPDTQAKNGLQCKLKLH